MNPFKKPKAPAPTPAPPPVPTIDDAANREEASRKFARRKGAKANIYGGAPGAPPPSVAAKQLLG